MNLILLEDDVSFSLSYFFTLIFDGLVNLFIEFEIFGVPFIWIIVGIVVLRIIVKLIAGKK